MTAPETGKKCAQCSADISSDALWGLCAKCLFDAADKTPDGERAPLASGRRFGDYELGEVVGRGGMGIVYQAMQVSLHRPVALKMIINSEAASPTTLRRFTLEAEAAAKLDHPNIVPIYEVGERDGQPFLSMKFIAGENLRSKIKNGSLCLLPRGEGTSKMELRERFIGVVRLLATIARAVHHAHEHGVLHRDLKPANILVDRDGQPHLTDFGLAKIMDPDMGEVLSARLTASGLVLGTPSYMSPEQAEGGRLTAASDIYSLGAILYEMLTGRPPFESATMSEMLRMLAELEPKTPSSRNNRIDKDLDTICLKCLEKSPIARYPTALAMAEDLERWLRQEPIRARPASPALRMRRWVARNRVGTALIGTLFIGLSVAVALLGLARARQSRLDILRGNSVDRFTRGVTEMWKDKAQQSVFISSSDLAELADLPPRRAESGAQHLTIGISINHDPANQATQLAPFLSALERRMENNLRHPILIDLRLYKSETDSIVDAGREKLDIQRMSSLAYVLAKPAISGLSPVVRERSQKEAVIFAIKGAGISNLAQVAGRRMAFGQSNSMLTFWAKAQLVRAGIRGTNLQHYFHLNGLNPYRAENPARPKGSEDRDSDTQAYKQAIEEVLVGHAEAGAAPSRFFESYRYRRRGLVPLLAFQTTSDVYVARPGLDPELLRALRESLLSFQSREDRGLLARFSRNSVLEGFDAIADEDFKDIRIAMTNEVAEFERGRRAEVPAPQ